MRVPNELLRSEITVRDYEGSGARGPTYSEPRTMKAQVQPTTRVWIERDNTGVTQDIDALIVVRPESGPVAVEALVSWGSENYRVVRSYFMPDERRPSHIELAVTRYVVRSGSGSGS